MNQSSESTTKSVFEGEDTIIKVRDLHTYFYTDLGISRALNGVNLEIPRGKVMGVVGESGCGKSVTALSIMRMVAKPGKIVQGDITFFRKDKKKNDAIEEINLTKLEGMGPEMRSIRGAQMSMIFQEPMTSLNPSYTIGDQIMEAIILHQNVDKVEAERRAVEILDGVGMANPSLIVKRYPHELSGGMRQRAMISLALSCTPAVLFADEPTTALDVTTEAQILDLMRDLQKRIDMSIVFITHNLGVVAQMCDYVTVMYLGRVVEQATIDDTFYNPMHPYTSSLLRSIPHVGSHQKDRLKPIRGVVPDPYSKVKGCPFHPRCDKAMRGLCDVKVPGLTVVGKSHTVRCFLHSDVEEESTYVQ
ncbi:MAG: ABC transporter ATP-binding protein [Anaerolineae bacterium]|nr:ABC transporter ATP-binding protein [Anaerolineae bacterium]